MAKAKPTKKRKIPMRKCVVTQQQFPKKELVRLVRTPEGTIEIDPSGRKNGRGAYISLNPQLVETAKQKNVFQQVFGVDVPDAFYEELFHYLDNQLARKELFKNDN